MAKSRKKYPFTKYSKSNKYDKKKSNKRYRHRCKRVLHNGGDIYPLMREVSNVYAFSSDGLARNYYKWLIGMDNRLFRYFFYK